MKQKLSEYGHEIVTVLIDEPVPSKEVAGAFNRVIAAQREQNAATAEAEALKIRQVGEARANAEGLKLSAQAYVDQRKTLAEGIGEAMKQIRDGLNGVSDQSILDYFAGIDQRDAIRDASKGNGSVVVFADGNRSDSQQDTIALIKALQEKDGETA